MGDAETALPSSKKRVAGRQLSKDDPDPDIDAPEPEMGTFTKASDEVMATRRIVKVRRSQPPSAASLNPFAGICLVAPVDSSVRASNPVDRPETDGQTTPTEQNDANENSVIADEGNGTKIIDSVNKYDGTEESSKKLDEKSGLSSTAGDDKVKNDEIEEKTPLVETKRKDEGEEKTDPEAIKETNEVHLEDTEKQAKETLEEGRDQNENPVKESEKEVQEIDQKDPAVPAASLSSFQQLSSSQNAFSGLAGTGFPTSSFAFGSFAKEGSMSVTSSASPLAFKSESSSVSFGPESAIDGDSSLPLLGIVSDAFKSRKHAMQEVQVETGEENEEAFFTADAMMYEYLDGGWKERGRGVLKMNVSVSDAEKGRLVMRAKGNYRLTLNANLYPDMSVTNLDKRGVTFACVNSAAGEGNDGLATVALKFKDSSIVQEFREAVMAHKGQKKPPLF